MADPKDVEFDRGGLAGDYARDPHRGGLGDDYARDSEERKPEHEHAAIEDVPIGKASE